MRIAPRPVKGSSKAFALVTLLGMAFAQVAPGQGNLPPKVRADVLKTQIVAAYGDSDMARVLSLIDDLGKIPGVVMSPALRFAEARAAERLENYARTVAALEAYLSSTTSSDNNYQDALRWYGSLTAQPRYAALEQSMRDQRAREQAEADRRAADAQVDAQFAVLRKRCEQLETQANQARERADANAGLFGRKAADSNAWLTLMKQSAQCTMELQALCDANPRLQEVVRVPNTNVMVTVGPC